MYCTTWVNTALCRVNMGAYASFEKGTPCLLHLLGQFSAVRAGCSADGKGRAPIFQTCSMGFKTWWPIRLFNSWNISKSFLCGTCYVQSSIILLKHPIESGGHETNNYWVHDTIHVLASCHVALNDYQCRPHMITKSNSDNIVVHRANLVVLALYTCQQ